MRVFRFDFVNNVTFYLYKVSVSRYLMFDMATFVEEKKKTSYFMKNSFTRHVKCYTWKGIHFRRFLEHNQTRDKLLKSGCRKYTNKIDNELAGGGIRVYLHNIGLISSMYCYIHKGHSSDEPGARFGLSN